MLRAILNKSWRQHPIRHQLYGHLPPITKTIEVRWTRHAGHSWRSRDELIRDVLLWTPHMAGQKQDDKHEHTYSSYVRIRDAALKTCQRRWTIERSGERGSGISVLPARHDDDDDLLTEVVQSNEYYKSRADGVPPKVCLTTDRDFSVLTVLKKHVFYSSEIPEVTWYEPQYNIFPPPKKKCFIMSVEHHIFVFGDLFP